MVKLVTNRVLNFIKWDVRIRVLITCTKYLPFKDFEVHTNKIWKQGKLDSTINEKCATHSLMISELAVVSVQITWHFNHFMIFFIECIMQSFDKKHTTVNLVVSYIIISGNMTQFIFSDVESKKFDRARSISLPIAVYLHWQCSSQSLLKLYHCYWQQELLYEYRLSMIRTHVINFIPFYEGHT